MTRVHIHDTYDGAGFLRCQLFEVFRLLVELAQKARHKIALIDSCIGISTLNTLTKKAAGVSVSVYTLPRTRLTQADIDTFNSQYPTLTVQHATTFHDRFMIIDGLAGYHIGASLKDAGRKCFVITKIQDAQMVEDILERLKRV